MQPLRFEVPLLLNSTGIAKRIDERTLRRRRLFFQSYCTQGIPDEWYWNSFHGQLECARLLHIYSVTGVLEWKLFIGVDVQNEHPNAYSSRIKSQFLLQRKYASTTNQCYTTMQPSISYESLIISQRRVITWSSGISTGRILDEFADKIRFLNGKGCGIKTGHVLV